MKKILFTVASVFIISVSTHAQTDVATMNKETTKQAKEQAKQKQNEELEKALKDAGIAEDKATEFKETLKIQKAPK